MGLLRSFATCITRMRHAPWSQVLFGEDPYLVLTLILIGGLVIYPLLQDLWPFISVLLVLAGLVHVWLWCLEHRADGGGTGCPEDGAGPT